jgi:secreted PhoX family phosphatase
VKYLKLILLLSIKVNASFAQHISNFVSISPAAQNTNLEIPSTHAFQVLFQAGDTLNNTVIPINTDFTAYVSKNNSSTEGYLSTCHENLNGSVLQMNVQFDAINRMWNMDSAKAVDFTSVAGTERPCSGIVTPWQTVIHGEENLGTTDINNDGYIDGGWLVETNPVTKTVVRKIYAAGRGSHENCAISANQQVLYTSNDMALFGFIFRYKFNTPGVDSSGTLYALQLTGKTGIWLPIPNTTIADRNNAYLNAYNLGATNFNGVEDIEIAADHKIYFGSKASGIIFRFTDHDTAIAGFDTFVANQIYMVNTDNGPVPVYWGIGIDNLAFDNVGNLWALQDGGQNYIWKIASTHTMANPNISLFARIPLGAEPTGITFSPDNKFMFLSLQHPFASNATTQIDALGKPVIWNRDATLAIALQENIGSFQPLQLSPFLDITCNNDLSILHISNPNAQMDTIEWQHSNDGTTFFTFEKSNKKNTQTSMLANYFRVKVDNQFSNIATTICNKFASTISINSNPVAEEIVLQVADYKGQKLEYKILDIYGKVLLAGIYDNNAINVVGLPNGIYNLVIKSKDQYHKALLFSKQ